MTRSGPLRRSPIRIGIVGCGRVLAAHLRGYRLLRAAGVDSFRITALCSPKRDDALQYVTRGSGPQQRRAVSDLPGDPLSIGDEYLSDFQPGTDVAIYTDYQSMIREAPIDAVNDFSTHALHHRVAQCAFEHGKHLLSQKPMAITVAAARQMCDAADARGLVFGVFENFRFLPQSRHLAWLFRSGLIGPARMILIGYVGAWWGPDRIVAETPWRHRKIEGGGISLDLGVHFFDQIRQVAGEIESVTAETTIVEPQRHRCDASGKIVQQIDCDADDTCYAQFATQNGATGTLVASWAGSGATLFGTGTTYYGARGHVAEDELFVADTSPTSFAATYQAKADAATRERDFPLGLSDSFALAQLDWLEAVRLSRPPEMDGRQGLADLAAAYAILESAHLGRRVQVVDVLSGAIRGYQEPLDQHFQIAR